jgi:hypothetical protein
VTLEDALECLIQEEIYDEMDVADGHAQQQPKNKKLPSQLPSQQKVHSMEIDSYYCMT